MMMRLMIFLAALGVLLVAGKTAQASSHMDFHRQQCNSGTAALAAQVRGCSRIAGSDRFEADAKGIAYYNMGVAYGLNEQFNKAVENYTKALRLNPGDSDAAFNRDLALQVLKEPEKKPGGRPKGQPGGQPKGKKEIARTDLPEDMRRNTSAQKVKQKKKVQKTQKKRTIKKQTKAKRTRAKRKKVE